MNPRLVQLTTSPAFAWWIRHVASKLDPLLFKATNGRLTSMGPPVVPMLTVTTIGRRSGRPHAVHLACVQRAGDYLIVASAMGHARHPAWAHNLDANPDVQVQMAGERFPARAMRLGPAERDTTWPELCRAIPQLAVYAQRTARTIPVYRLRRIR